jgi:hypothetical protein
LAAAIDKAAADEGTTFSGWLAEAWRGGGRRASLSRMLAMCEVEPMSEDQARRVGVLAGKARHDDIVDIAVVEGAVRRRDAVVTSDDEHIRLVAAAAGADCALRAFDRRANGDRGVTPAERPQFHLPNSDLCVKVTTPPNPEVST